MAQHFPPPPPPPQHFIAHSPHFKYPLSNINWLLSLLLGTFILSVWKASKYRSCIIIALLWKSGAILDLPCPSVILSCCYSVLLRFFPVSWEWIYRLRPNFVYIFSLTRSTLGLWSIIFANLQQSYGQWLTSYLTKEWTEFNQILYTQYHWQGLHWDCKVSFFLNLQQSYGPWLMSVFGF